MKRLVPGLLILAWPLGAAISNVRVTDITPTQAVVRYVAPSSAACSLKVAAGAGLSPLAPDVDPSLFTNADSDNRDNQNLSNGLERAFVVGKRIAALDLNGKYTSRALRNNTRHHGQITCGGDTATFDFRTSLLPSGASYIEPFPVDPANPANIAWPTMTWADNADGDGVIDPQSGTYIQRLSQRSAEGPLSVSPTWAPAHAFVGTAADCSTTAGWTNPCNIVTGAGNATYSAATTPQAQLQLVGTGAYSQANVERISFNITASMGGGATGEDLKIQVCLTVNQGSCYGPWVDVALTGSLALVAPSWDFMTGISSTGHANLYGTNQQPPDYNWQQYSSGSADTSGTQIDIRYLPAQFPLVQTLAVNSKIYLNSVEYNIASVASGISLTTSSSAGTQSSVSFSYPHFGMILRKKTNSTHTLTVSGATVTMFEYNDSFLSGGAGFTQTCDPIPQPQGWTIAGAANTSPITITTGQNHGYSTGNQVVIQDVNGNTAANGTWTITVTGAATFTIPVAGNGTYAGYTALNQSASVSGLVYRTSDPKGYICSLAPNIGDSEVYWINPQTGHREFLGPGNWVYTPATGSVGTPIVHIDPVLYPAAGGYYSMAFDGAHRQILKGTYRANTTFGLNRDVGHCDGIGNSCGSARNYSWTVYTPDVGGLLTAFDPNWLCPIPPRIGDNIEGAFLMSSNLGNQNSLGCLAYFDIASNNFVASGNTWKAPGSRFAGNHTTISWSGFDRGFVSGYKLLGLTTDPYTGPFGKTYTGTIGASVTNCPSNPLGLSGVHCTNITVDSGNVVQFKNTTVGFDTLTQFRVGDALVLWDDVNATNEEACHDFPNVNDVGGCPIVAISGNVLTVYRTTPVSHASGGIVAEFSTGFVTTATHLFNTSSAYLVWDWKNDPHMTNDACPYGGQTANCTVTGLVHAAQMSHGGGAANPAGSYYVLINDSGGDAQDLNSINNFKGYEVFTGSTTQSVLFTPDAAYTVTDSPAFSGALGVDNGDALEHHLNYNTVRSTNGSAYHFGDSRAQDPNPSQASECVLASGATQVYKCTSYNQTHPYDPKRNIVWPFAGHHGFLQIAGDGVTLTDASADNWKACLAYKATDCWTGSAAGELYLNCPQCNPWPRGSDGVQTGLSGTFRCPAVNPTAELLMPCAMTLSSASNRYVQYPLYGRNDDGRNDRIVSSFLNRSNSVDPLWNSRELPDGSWVMSQTWYNGVRNEIVMAQLGPLAPNDGLNRMEYVPTRIHVPAVPGATNAYVRFGYDPNFFCNPLSRSEACISTATTFAVGATHPYMYEVTDKGLGNYTLGASCSSGCDVIVPAISPRLMYYQVVLTDSAGVIRYTGNQEVIGL